jgi:membrane-bound lytic murein transglycosylase B
LAARASPRWRRRAIPRATIKADRAQHSFKLSLDQFMEKRGAATIVSQGRKLKAQNAKLFATLEKRYGVPPGPLIAIWGMETAFGSYMGKQNTISAVATLAYDCRRPDFFREQLIAALKLVDEGVLSSGSIGAMHGEVGQTQFLPKNVILYGADADGGGINLNKKADALASTANFLRGHGWQPAARDISRANPISPRSRAGTRPACIRRRSPSWAARSTETKSGLVQERAEASLLQAAVAAGGDRGDDRPVAPLRTLAAELRPVDRHCRRHARLCGLHIPDHMAEGRADG